MKVIDNNILNIVLKNIRSDNYDKKRAIDFANEYFKDEDDTVEYSENFITSMSDLMLFFDTINKDEVDKFKAIVDSMINLLEAKKKPSRKEVLEILSLHLDMNQDI